MSGIKKLLSLAAFAALAADNSFYMSEPRIDNTKPYNKGKSLPRWKVGENTIYARNESDAIKYAKKRGLYKDGDTAVKID